MLDPAGRSRGEDEELEDPVGDPFQVKPRPGKTLAAEAGAGGLESENCTRKRRVRRNPTSGRKTRKGRDNKMRISRSSRKQRITKNQKESFHCIRGAGSLLLAIRKGKGEGKELDK